MPFVINAIPRHVLGAVPFEGLAARTYLSTNQSIPNNSWTAVSFDNTRFDTDVMWSGSNPDRLTVNTAGIYYIYGNAELAAGGASTTQKSIRIVMVDTEEAETEIAAWSYQASTSNPSAMSADVIRYLPANYYLELQIYQNTGSALNVLNSGKYSPELGAYRIGDLS